MKRSAQSMDYLCISRPFTGAWIETTSHLEGNKNFDVAPSRGRGLKLTILLLHAATAGSPLHGGVD